MAPSPFPGHARPTKAMDYVCLAFLGLAVSIPFLYPRHTLPRPSFYGEWLAIALGTGACIVFLTEAFWKNLSIPKSALYLSWLIGWIALQSLVVEHVYATQALLPALYLGWAALLVVIARWLRQRLTQERALSGIAWFLLIGGMLQMLAGLSQYLGLDGMLTGWVDLRQSISIHGNIAQTNHFATHVTLAALALIYLHASSRISRSPTIALLAFFAIILTLSGSRSVWLYILGILILSLAAYKKTRNPVHRLLASSSGLLGALFLAAQLLMPPVSEWLNFETSTAIQRGISGAVQPRLVEWHKAWLIFSQSPIIGVGIGNYGWHSFNLHVIPKFTSTPSDVIFHHSHNLFMQILAELGIIGLLLLGALLVSWFRQFSQHWLVPTNWLIAGVLLVLFTHSNLEYPLWYSYFLGIVAVFMSLGDERTIRVVFTPRLGQIAAATALVLTFAILAVTYAGFRDLAMVNMLILKSSPEQAASRIQAIAKNPLLTPWAEATLATHGRPSEGEIEHQLALTTRVMLHHPNPIKVQRQIVYLTLSGHMEGSVSLMRQAAAAYTRPFARFACSLRESSDERIRPLVDEADRIMTSDWYIRIVPNPHAECVTASS